jgi:hypothetical protein
MVPCRRQNNYGNATPAGQSKDIPPASNMGINLETRYRNLPNERGESEETATAEFH